MKNLLNHKILIILTIFAIIMGFGSSVFAVSFEYNNNIYDIDLASIIPVYDNYDNHIILKFSYEDYITVFLTNDDSFTYRDGFYRIYGVAYWLYENNGTYTASEINPYQERGFNMNTLTSSFIWADNDITYNNEVVFQGAPQEQITEVPEITTTLVEQGTQAQMGETLLATIKTYLVYLVIFVVSMIAIWKAVRFLRNVLKTS